MIFQETRVSGAYLLLPERFEDERGSFARMFCRDEYAALGLAHDLAQASLSVNTRAGTLRGMHFTVAPGEEVKTVWCVRGAIHDVILDLRPASPTYKQWQASELSADNARGLYVPAGVAHGFLTREADSHVWYAMNVVNVPECARGVRWDDPAFGIEWPEAPAVISARDASYPLAK